MNYNVSSNRSVATPPLGEFIYTENNGQDITATDYWESSWARAGKLRVSVNAGAIRILLPETLDVNEMIRGCKYCILSRGPWPLDGNAEGVEILFEDGSDAPYVQLLSTHSFDILPAAPMAGRQWVLSLWVNVDGKPVKKFETTCYWRRVKSIPYLKPLHH